MMMKRFSTKFLSHHRYKYMFYIQLRYFEESGGIGLQLIPEKSESRISQEGKDDGIPRRWPAGPEDPGPEGAGAGGPGDQEEEVDGQPGDEGHCQQVLGHLRLGGWGDQCRNCESLVELHRVENR